MIGKSPLACQGPVLPICLQVSNSVTNGVFDHLGPGNRIGEKRPKLIGTGGRIATVPIQKLPLVQFTAIAVRQVGGSTLIAREPPSDTLFP
jgi:hypothetical protein